MTLSCDKAALSNMFDPNSIVVSGPIPMENAITCPISQPEAIGVPSRHPHVRLGVVVLLMDDEGSLLITRRAAHMRTFPRAWVFPGGSQDPGETLPIAAARELQEETGVEVDTA